MFDLIYKFGLLIYSKCGLLTYSNLGLLIYSMCLLLNIEGHTELHDQFPVLQTWLLNCKSIIDPNINTVNRLSGTTLEQLTQTQNHVVHCTDSISTHIKTHVPVSEKCCC